MTKHGRLLLALPLMLALIALGCSGNKKLPGKVSGTVKYNGKLVTGGTMMFHSADKGSYPANIKGDGTYMAEQIPAGEMMVTIETESANKDRVMPEYGGKKGMMSPPPPDRKMGGSDQVYVKIPAKYGDKDKTDLKVNITAGTNTHNFDLKD